MTQTRRPLVIENAWRTLRSHTDARIAPGRTGFSLPTEAHLEFQLAHARARDAVHLKLALGPLQQSIEALQHRVIMLHSAAADRRIYLQRPDLGRRLDDPSRVTLNAIAREWAGEMPGEPRARPFDLLLVLADGLSALAVERNAEPLLAALGPRLRAAGIRIAPVVVVEQGRVAIGDEIGEILGAPLVAMLIGERPGLSSPDSLGIYLTWAPRIGRSDAERNCISNIRAQGMSYEQASKTLTYLVCEAQRRQLTGVALKDESPAAARVSGTSTSNFLLT